MESAEKDCNTPNTAKFLKGAHREMRTLFEQGITVRYLFVKLVYCDINDDAASIKKFMVKCDFDVMGIAENDVIDGYVEQSTMKDGRCEKYRRTFHPSDLIAESTPLVDLLTIFNTKPHVFVLKGNRVSGLVTRGDLRKAPGRLLFFGLFSTCEMYLTHLIRIIDPDDNWKKTLDSESLKKAESIYTKQKKNNEQIDLVECLFFRDKLKIIMDNHVIRERIDFQPKESIEDFINDATTFRNNLAHGHDIIKGLNWSKVFSLTEQIVELIDKCEEKKD